MKPFKKTKRQKLLSKNIDCGGKYNENNSMYFSTRLIK